MKKSLVLYYSCSANTKTIAEFFNESLVALGWESNIKRLDSNCSFAEFENIDLIVLGVPVHYWEMPDVALELIRKLPRLNNTYGFVFSTFGKCVSNSVSYSLALELKDKGVNVIGGAQIAMPHSSRIDENNRLGDLEIHFGKGEPTNENKEKIRLAIEIITNKLETKSVNEFDLSKLKDMHTRGIMANIMNLIISKDNKRSLMPQIMYDESKCNHCKMCVSYCNTNSIEYVNESGVFFNQKNCEKCYKCIEGCNSKALYTDWEKMVNLTRSIRKFAKNNETKIMMD